MQIFLHKFAICRIYDVLSKGFTLKSFTRVRDWKGTTAWSGQTNVTEKWETVGKYKRKLPARLVSAVSSYLHKQRIYNRCLPVFIHTSVANTMQRYCFLLRYASYIQ